MKSKILITSALPYANGPLHFGHIAGAYLPADAYARFERLLKNDVLYICGSDEYGIAITLSAEMAGLTPKEHVDIYHQVNKDFFKNLNISFDHYSRTSWAGHKEPVQEFFTDLLNNGYIEEKLTEQLYSEKEGRFLADRYVTGTCPKCGFTEARGDECTSCGASFEATELINPRSRLTGTPLTRKSTKHWFLLLDKFKERLTSWLETKKWKPNVQNFIKGYINELHPRAITRDMTWGVPIPLPDTEGKVLYVWFDAPIGYISATQEFLPDRWKDYWCDPETKLVNFIGKDNIPFHAAIFPAMIMGQNKPYKLVDELPANEFYKLEGRQFSKSEGWTIDLERFFKRFSADQIRYVIAANAPETADSEFTWQDFQSRCNADLLGKYGNLVNRCLVFAKNHLGGVVPPHHSLESIDLELKTNLKRLAREIHEAYATFRLRKAASLIMELAAYCNVYFDKKKPWSDAKNSLTKERMETTINLCLDAIKLLALVSYPIIPEASGQVWSFLGYKTPMADWDEIVSTPIPPGQLLAESKVLFRRIEDEEIKEEISLLHKNLKSVQKKEATYEALKGAVEIDDVKKLDLRVGLILGAESVAKSKKLLKLQVDLGFEKRQIVSGIALHYTPEQLVGQKVIVIANLKPATLMGVESQGMILAASLGSGLEAVFIRDMPPGAIVS